MLTSYIQKFRAPKLSFLLQLLLVVGFFSLASGSVHLWSSQNPAIIPASRFVVLPTLILALIIGALMFFKKESPRLSLWPYAYALPLVFLTSWMESMYSFFHAPLIRGELMLFGLAYLFLGFEKFKKLLLPLAFGFLAILVLTFWQTANGRLIYSDDIGTFLYRLQLLAQNFPNLPFYNPQWNAGLEQRDFFATGALLLHFLLMPVRILTGLKVDSLINGLVLSLGVILPAISIYSSARLLRLSKTAALIASILALAPGLFWFRWVIKYGTLGFVAATVIFPIVLALLYRIAEQKENTRRFELLLFILFFSLYILWPFAGVIALPALIACLIFVGRNCLKPKLLGTAALLLMVNLPWMYIFFSSTQLSKFLTMESVTPAEKELSSSAGPDQVLSQERKKNTALKHPEVKLELQSFLRYLRDNLLPINPLLIFLVIPGCALLRGKARWFVASTTIWLLTLALIVSVFKPQLELHRMFVFLSVFGCIPAALAIESLLKEAASSNSVAKKATGALMVGFLITGPLCSGKVLANRTPEQAHFVSANFDEIRSAIETEGKRSGGARVLFSGCVIHEFEDGHLAPLAELTKVPLMASSHLHNLWWYKQIFPDEYLLDKQNGIQRYLDTYNVSAVFAHEPVWRKYFLERPNEFRLIRKIGRFWLFRRVNFSSNYFLEGSGQLVAQNSNSLKITPLSQNVILKFNYLPNLISSGCELSVYKASATVELIHLKNCTVGAEVTIRRRGVL